jgi:carboxypeptidase PM20D1
MKTLKRLGVALVLLVAVLLINVWRLPAPHAAAALPPLTGIDESAVAKRLAGAVRIATISYGEPERNDGTKLAAFADYLRVTFPRVHAQLKRETVNGHSLLFTWTGSDANAKPMLLLAHQDVVPVEPGTEKQWLHAPFSGDIADGFVWGRGALDDKGSLVAQLEAIESLLAQGFKPRRTLMLALGHDEEIGGKGGAKKVAEELKARGLHFEFALDEGGSITEGIIGGVSVPVAGILAAEKGYATFRLTTRDAGGHSSRPPPQTAIGRLARAVSRVQDAPFPTHLAHPVTDMLDRLAPEMPFPRRLLIANRWLFGPVLRKNFSETPITNAMVRTTTAPTIIHAGIKDNVLPSEAYAAINFRLLPGDSVQDVEDHIRRVVADEAVEITHDGNFSDEPSPVADINSPSFAVIAKTVEDVFPDTVISTGLVIGATDLRNYAGVYEHRYNFAPFRIKPEDLVRIHGHNERLSVSDYVRGIEFYRRLIQNANS